MVCTYCGGETSVINSRPQKRANRVWRRRKCDDCGNVATTVEGLDHAASISYKPAVGRLEPFQRDILFVSVLDSLRHRKTATSDATALTDSILAKLKDYLDESGAVDRTRLVKHVSEVLTRFDSAAGVHYQAYHPL